MRRVDGPGLIGRESELTLLDSFIAELGGARSALTLEGDPGIGKSALWEEALRHAIVQGLTVLSCRPAEAEARLAFAALSDLLEPVKAKAFTTLPAPQRRALEVALLEADAQNGAVDPRAVAAGLRSVLVDLAGRSPVLIAIDDAQWIDAPSAGALEFALRRLDDRPIGILLARRASVRPAPRRLDLPDARRLLLEPLSLASVHDLLKQRLGGSIPRPLLVRVYETSAGNPLFALEIARELVESGSTFVDALPVPESLRSLVERRVTRLTTAKEALLVAAALAHPTVPIIGAAIADDPSAALAQAELAGVIELDVARVRFTHPLYAAAIYGAAAPARRGRIHERLARLVDDPEERAQHLALAAESPSEDVAAALEQAAARARARGAPATAAELLARAVGLTPADGHAEARRRRLAEADALLRAGAPEQAHAILEKLVDPLPPGDERARVLVRLAEVTPDLERAIALLERAAREVESDQATRSLVHLRLGAGWPARGVPYALRHGRLALRYAELAGQRELTIRTLTKLALWELWAGRNPDGHLMQALDLEAPGDELSGYDNPRLILAIRRMYQGRLEEARREIEGLRREAESRGDEIGSLLVSLRLADVELRAGNWTEASAVIEPLHELASQVGFGHDAGHVAIFKAWVDAHLGRVEQARSAVAAGVEVATGTNSANTMGIALGVLGLLELSLGNDAEALGQLRPLIDWLDEKELGLSTHPSFPVALEALIATGELEEARSLLDRFEAQARVLESPWALAIAARSRGLLAAAEGDLASALAALEAACASGGDGRWPFERALTLLALGRVQRRLKQKSAAKETLEQAIAIFEALPAPLWATRAQEELRRIGLRSRASQDLTETERRVAELAGSGLKNREVAAQLFMSPKTVEANLARVYRKLGISSRAELGSLMAQRPREPAQT